MAPFIIGISMLVVICGCIRPWPASTNQPVILTIVPTYTFEPPHTSTPLPLVPSAVPTSQPEPTQTKNPHLMVWFDPDLVSEFSAEWKLAPEELALSESLSNLRFEIGGSGTPIGTWIYALAAPFPTLTDTVKLSDVISTWQGSPGEVTRDLQLMVDDSTRQVLERAWGVPSSNVVVVNSAEQVDTAWREKTYWAILPFEKLAPRWKVIRVEGVSPYDRNLDIGAYGLSFPVTMQGEAWAVDMFAGRTGSTGDITITNRDPEKLTVLVMTGVSALVRGTAWFMQQKGLLYPGRDIRGWLLDADLTHVSNEVSFNPKCPSPDANDPTLSFCSDPQNIQLLEDVGVDIVEMTGNHLNDFGWEWVNYTIEMYKARGWYYFGAGADQEQARKPVLITDHGNRLAFIGCNPAGPPADWATVNTAGTADCGGKDMDTFTAEIRRLVGEGYLTIVTVQYYESYDPTPLPIHYRDFRRLSDAGAVIVSGSQAHLPQAMELRGHGFIHYGLGNLFFDQMDTPWPDTRNEFNDRHVFYDGRYLGVDLLTATLEDYVKPRPMTAAEREAELAKIFMVSGWPQTDSKEWR